MTQPPVSPRVDTLRKAVEAGDSSALARFWAEVDEAGAPLVEPAPDDDRHVLVTFLWRGAYVRHVLVFTQIDPWNLIDNQMARLPGTDVWYKSRPLRTDVRSTYRFSPDDSLVPFGAVADWRERTKTFHSDPLNPRKVVWRTGDDDDPSRSDQEWSVLELPDAPPQRWVMARPGVPGGRVDRQRLRSKVLHNERNLWVYTPPGYSPAGGPYGLLVLFDGRAYTYWVPTPTILDNLQVEGLLPPLVAVMVDNPSGEARYSELACSVPMVDFLAHELLPWLRERYPVTTNPMRTAIGGSSLGGLAAAFAGYERPDLFGNVVCQSGALFWRPRETDDYEWLTARIASGPRRPLQVSLDIGLLEDQTLPGGGPSALAATRRLRDVLVAKGYPVHYAEFAGGHDYLCWQGSLADRLIALLGTPGSRDANGG